CAPDVLGIARTTGALQFQVVTVGEQALPITQTLLSLYRIIVQQGPADIPPGSARECNEALRPTFQKTALQGDISPMLPVLIGKGNQFDQVAIAGMISDQQWQQRKLVRIIVFDNQQVAAAQRL